MARTCEVCQKEYMKGNSVGHGIGQRVSGRTIRRQQPNLRNKKFVINGKKVNLKLCASCLKKTKKGSEEERDAFLKKNLG